MKKLALALALCLVLSACGGAASSAPSSAPVESVSSVSSSGSANEQPYEPVERILYSIKSGLESDGNFSVEYSYDDTAATVYATANGLQDFMNKVSENPTEENLASWDGFSDSVSDMFDVLRDSLDDYGHSDLPAVLVLQSDNETADIAIMVNDDGVQFNALSNLEPVPDGTYPEGMYLVGKDIPAGEYQLTPNDPDRSSYYEVTSDSSGTLDSIIVNDNFDFQVYLTVSDGQYLTIKRATAQLVQ